MPINATAEQVKQAYRLLVKHHHPDGAGSGDADRFLEIQRAWEEFQGNQPK